MKTIIAVPDFTRDAHLKKVLPPILQRLKNEGVPERDIEIIIATGLHRPPTKEEIKKNIGPLADKIKISAHDYREDSVAYFGKTKKSIPVYLNKKLKDAESIITVGVVEPHLYAGYSGGTKVVAIGLGGEKTINATHHPRFLDHPGTKLCSVRKNTFRDFIHEVSLRLPIKYSVNIINDKNGSLLRIFCGDWKTSFKKAINYSRKIFEKKINRYFDAVVCDIPKSKGINIYQASRAFNYVADTKKSVLKRNAFILVKSGLEEGFGKGLGEKRFMDRIIKMKGPKELIAQVKKRGCLAGEHRAYMVAKAMLKLNLGFISRKAYLYKNRKLPFFFFRNSKDACEYIKKYFKKPAKIYYLKNAFNTILVKKHN